jgi:hypothetical protein
MTLSPTCDSGHPHLIDGKYYSVAIAMATKNGASKKEPKDLCEQCMPEWFRKETGRTLL